MTPTSSPLFARRTWLIQVVLPALMLTLLNALKDPTVDDAAYLAFARLVAADPVHAYDGLIFWSHREVPIHSILMPPVVPYWLGLGIALFGVNTFLLKLWLFPFALLFAHASRGFLRFVLPNFPWQNWGIWLAVCSPTVMPLFNFMLDVPALALALAAMVQFLAAGATGRLAEFARAGLLAGIAAQTKYTQMLLPLVMLLSALGGDARRRSGAILSASLAGGVFVAVEGMMILATGHSHFQEAMRNTQDMVTFPDWLSRQGGIAFYQLAQFGGMAWGFLPLLLARRSSGAVILAGLVHSAFVLSLALQPESSSFLAEEFPLIGSWPLSLVGFLGYGIILTLVLMVLVLRSWPGAAPARRVVILWIVCEVLGILVTSPFPAGRRVITLCLGMLVLVLSRMETLPRARCIPAMSLAIAWGLAFTGIEIWESRLEPAMLSAGRASIERPSDQRIWFVGHWGFQEQALREGMLPFDGQPDRLRPGDYLIVPTTPLPEGFSRPWAPRWVHDVPGHLGIPELVEVGRLESQDRIWLQTIPNLYGGLAPLCNREYPRMTLVIYHYRPQPRQVHRDR